MSVIGDNIRALRELNGLTQQELADIACVTRETVNKWETGSIGNVRTSNIETLRAYFGLSVDDLRSESCGLSAQLARNSMPAEQGAFLPVADSEGNEAVEVPSSILAKHPHAYARAVTDASMDNVLPLGCVAIVDPLARFRDDSIVLASLPEYDQPAFRRMHVGSTKALLTAESSTVRVDDVVADLETLAVLGVVVWYQAAQELA